METVPTAVASTSDSGWVPLSTVHTYSNVRDCNSSNPIHRHALLYNHDAPTAGQQGFKRTLDRMRQEAYWVGVAGDVERYCRTCTKFTPFQKTIVTSLSYGIKWAEALPLPEYTAACITGQLIKLLSVYGHPEVFHSEPGLNFETSILTQTL